MDNNVKFLIENHNVVTDMIKNTKNRGFREVDILVKNSIDAQSTEIKIEIIGDDLIVTDNGRGMSEDNINNKFLYVGYSKKARMGLEKRDYIGWQGRGIFFINSMSSGMLVSSKTRDCLEWVTKVIDTGTARAAKTEELYQSLEKIKKINNEHGTCIILQGFAKKYIIQKNINYYLTNFSHRYSLFENKMKISFNNVILESKHIEKITPSDFDRVVIVNNPPERLNSQMEKIITQARENKKLLTITTPDTNITGCVILKKRLDNFKKYCAVGLYCKDIVRIDNIITRNENQYGVLYSTVLDSYEENFSMTRDTSKPEFISLKKDIKIIKTKLQEISNEVYGEKKDTPEQKLIEKQMYDLGVYNLNNPDEVKRLIGHSKSNIPFYKYLYIAENLIKLLIEVHCKQKKKGYGEINKRLENISKGKPAEHVIDRSYIYQFGKLKDLQKNLEAAGHYEKLECGWATLEEIRNCIMHTQNIKPESKEQLKKICIKFSKIIINNINSLGETVPDDPNFTMPEDNNSDKT